MAIFLYLLIRLMLWTFVVLGLAIVAMGYLFVVGVRMIWWLLVWWAHRDDEDPRAPSEHRSQAYYSSRR